MKFHEKNYSLIIIGAILAGLGGGQFDAVRETGGTLILPLLILMLFVTFIPIRIDSFLSSFLNVRFTVSSLVVNFLWTPLFAWILAAFFLQGHPALAIGFILLMVTPCTDWYIVFTGLAKGNKPLSAAILPVNLLLQMFLLPVYLFLFAGAQTEVDMTLLLESVLTVLFLPLLAALALNALTKKFFKEKNKPYAFAEALPVYLLALAIAAIFASQGEALINHAPYVILIFVPIILFFAVNFLIGAKISSIMRLSFADRVSFHMTTLARNSPLALTVAVSAFPDEPLIALTLVIGSLLELPILAGLSQLLKIISHRKKPLKRLT
jgi:arsenite transporter